MHLYKHKANYDKYYLNETIMYLNYLIIPCENKYNIR